MANYQYEGSCVDSHEVAFSNVLKGVVSKILRGQAPDPNFTRKSAFGRVSPDRQLFKSDESSSHSWDHGSTPQWLDLIGKFTLVQLFSQCNYLTVDVKFHFRPKLIFRESEILACP